MVKSDLIIVKNSKVHGTGVFAAKDIKKDSRIIEYVGEKIDKDESDERYDRALEFSKSNPDMGMVYIFDLNDEYDIDGDVSYNTAKWINHSCNPNCEVEIIDDHIWIIALRDIKAGEELSYNYGYETIDDFEDHPCKCGSDDCVGYILSDDLWPELKKKLEKKNSISG